MIPKFRVWNKEVGSMHHVVSIWFDDAPHVTIPFEGSVANIFSEFELMQSTGLKDKNGVEIFDGDIFAEGFGRYVVAWDAQGARWVLKFAHDFEDTFHLGMRNSKDMTLIGNIYENPELLEAEK